MRLYQESDRAELLESARLSRFPRPQKQFLGIANCISYPISREQRTEINQITQKALDLAARISFEEKGRIFGYHLEEIESDDEHLDEPKSDYNNIFFASLNHNTPQDGLTRLSFSRVHKVPVVREDFEITLYDLQTERNFSTSSPDNENQMFSERSLLPGLRDHDSQCLDQNGENFRELPSDNNGGLYKSINVIKDNRTMTVNYTIQPGFLGPYFVIDLNRQFIEVFDYSDEHEPLEYSGEVLARDLYDLKNTSSGLLRVGSEILDRAGL